MTNYLKRWILFIEKKRNIYYIIIKKKKKKKKKVHCICSIICCDKHKNKTSVIPIVVKNN